MSEMTIELAPFTAKPGVTDREVLDASAALQRDFLAHQPGFVRRDLLRSGNGQWLDLVYWRDAAAAEAVIAAAMASPACHAYFGIMDGADHANAGAGVSHFALKQRYDAAGVQPAG